MVLVYHSYNRVIIKGIEIKWRNNWYRCNIIGEWLNNIDVKQIYETNDQQ